MSDVVSPDAVDQVIASSDDDFGGDSLSSSFMSSFSLPPPTPKKASTPPAATTEPPLPTSETPASLPTSSAPPAEPVEDFNIALEANLKTWRAESSIAREKSESTRLRMEEDAAKERARLAKEAKDEKTRLSKAQEDAEVERKLKDELARAAGRGKGKKAAKREKEAQESERWANVKDAWEIVKEGGSSSAEKVGEVIADARDLTGGDAGGKEGNTGKEMLEQIHAATQAVAPQPSDPSSSRRTDILSSSSNPTASLPPAEDRQKSVADAWKATSNRSQPVEQEGVAHSQSKLVQGLTEPVPTGISPSGLSTADLPEDENRSLSQPSNSPPSQPPSLTLSLFTVPSHRSLLRFAAVLGINLVLPFINGVMLGFGEIFARETVKWGKLWWRGEVKFRGWTGGPGSRTAGLGLSGSFP